MTEATEAANGVSSKQRLLDAGVEAISTDFDELLRKAFTAGSVSARAGLARRTFYDNFPTVHDFVDGLVVHLASTAALGPESSVVELFAEHDGSVAPVVQALVADHFARVRERKGWRAGYLVEILGSTTTAAAPDAVWHDLLATLREFGYLPRPPLNDGDIVGAIRAVIDGLAIRDVEAAPSPAQAATAAVLGMLSSMTESPGAEPGTAPTDAMSRHIESAWNERDHDRPVVNVRRLVLDAAAEELARHGAGRLDLSLLSERTGLSVPAIAKYVGNRRQLLEALLDRVYPGLLLALIRDLDGDGEAAGALGAHCQRVAALFDQSPEYAETELALRSKIHIERISNAGRELMETVGKVMASLSTSADIKRVDHVALGEWGTHVIAVGVSRVSAGTSSSVISRAILSPQRPEVPASDND